MKATENTRQKERGRNRDTVTVREKGDMSCDHTTKRERKRGERIREKERDRE